MNTDRAAAARLEGWLDLADRGWHLFPVRPGSKVPAITQWEQRATTEPDRLTRFFTANPDHNAGIACGPSGLLVVDCDLPKPGQRLSRVDGREQLKTLAYEHGGVPATWEVFTPSGGTHLYFRAPADRTLGNSSHLLGPLLDTRGRGGQVVAPGSVLPSGGYALVEDRDPAALPEWMAERLSAPHELGDRSERAGPVSDRSAYVAAAVQAELARIRDAERGQHNTAVFTASRALGQLAAGGLLDPTEARREVLTAAERLVAGPCDCTAAEIAATVRSGLVYGARRPRELPTPRVSDRELASTDRESPSSEPESVVLFDKTDHYPAEVLVAARDAAARDDLAAAGRILGIETPPPGPPPGNEAARAAVAAIDDDLISTQPPHESFDETSDETSDSAGWAR